MHRSTWGTTEFYDPDAADHGRPEADIEVELPQPAPTIPKPLAEWVVLGLTGVAVLAVVWLQGRPSGVGRMFALVQLAYPVVIALVASAITSLLRRRVLRAQRQMADDLLAVHLAISRSSSGAMRHADASKDSRHSEARGPYEPGHRTGRRRRRGP